MTPPLSTLNLATQPTLASPGDGQFKLDPVDRIHWRRTTRKRPCPVCHRYGWCEISDNEKWAHCMHMPNHKPMRWRGGGWLHQLQGEVSGPKAEVKVGLNSLWVPAQTSTPPPPLAPALIDQVNRALLGICPLSEAHHTYLEGEGVDPVGCGSLRYCQAATVAKELVRRFGEEVAQRHPALLKITSEDGKRSWWTLAGAADGIIFPAISYDGLILGLQLRKDQPKGKDDRYRWLSHAGLGGTPLSVFRAKEGAQSPHHLIITEGYKKAAVASRRWDCHSISLPGVTSYRVADLIQTIEALGVQSISVAFDQDKRLKPQVQQAEQKLLRILAAAFGELELFYLEWDASLGKGLDDAVKKGAIGQFVSAAPDSGPRFVNDLPLEALARVFGAAKPLYTLEEARRGHRAFMDRLIAQPDNSTTIITSITGTGKSQATDDAVAEAVMAGRLHQRVVILAPNKANIEERIQPHTLLGKAVASGKVVIQRGRRLIDLAQPRTPQPEDCANPEALAAGAARHAAARVVCATCPFGSQKNWEEKFPGEPRPFQCEKEGYLASRKRSDAAQAVLATKEAYLNNSEKLGEFELIICDEDLLPYLYESVVVNTEVMQGWREKIALRQLDVPDWVKLMQVIERALDQFSTEFRGARVQSKIGQAPVPNPKSRPLEEEYELLPSTRGEDSNSQSFTPHNFQSQDTISEEGQTIEPKVYQVGRLYPALPALQKAASELGYVLSDLLAQCAKPRLYDPGQDDTYNFEKHYRHNGKLVLPYRAATALLKALLDQHNPPYAVCNTQGSFSLEILVVRSHLIETLHEKTVAILDATVPPTLEMLFPDMQELHYEVKQNIEVTQITNGLYSKQDLYNSLTRQQLSQAIQAFTRESKRPLAMLPLRFQQGAEAIILPENCQSEHWGLHKATSKFSDCDTLVMVGHHLRPIDRIRAEVIALRAEIGSRGLDDQEVELLVNPGLRSPKRKLRLYNHWGGYGYACGRWMHSEQDVEVQAAIEHDFVSHVMQAIGRLRAALRPAHLPPARVLILCNEPVANLKIDKLTTVKKLGADLLSTHSTVLSSEVGTNSPKAEDFIENTYMETPSNPPLVWAARVEEPGLHFSTPNRLEGWDEDLIQDETVETQFFDPWEEDLPSQQAGKPSAYRNEIELE